MNDQDVSISVVYITCGSRDEAENIGWTLVEERLAACVNIFSGMTSMYRWENKLEQAEETVLICKTRDSLVDALEDKVKALHSYDCPCIIALPVSRGFRGYLDWIYAETEQG